MHCCVCFKTVGCPALANAFCRSRSFSFRAATLCGRPEQEDCESFSFRTRGILDCEWLWWIVWYSMVFHLDPFSLTSLFISLMWNLHRLYSTMFIECKFISQFICFYLLKCIHFIEREHQQANSDFPSCSRSYSRIPWHIAWSSSIKTIKKHM